MKVATDEYQSCKQVLGLSSSCCRPASLGYCYRWYAIVFLVSMCVYNPTECMIKDYDVFSYDETVIEPNPIRGYFRYIVPCGGIVTSIEARGFCGRANDVELRLLYGYKDSKGIHISTELVEAECNTSANVSSEIYEGTVRNDSLNIIIPHGGDLRIYLIPDCSKEKCYFQPAIINKTSSYTMEFRDDEKVWRNTNLSLLFSANIKTLIDNETLPSDDPPNGNYTTIIVTAVAVVVVAGGVCIGLLLLVVVLIQCRRKKAQTVSENSHIYEEIPEELKIRAEIELQQNTSYGHNNFVSTSLAVI